MGSGQGASLALGLSNRVRLSQATTCFDGLSTRAYWTRQSAKTGFRKGAAERPRLLFHEGGKTVGRVALVAGGAGRDNLAEELVLACAVILTRRRR